MSSKKIATILSILEIAQKNVQTALQLVNQLANDKTDEDKPTASATTISKMPVVSVDEASALEVVEGYFDGENMVGDNGQIYPVPQTMLAKLSW
jgi:hypothetical protein